MSKYLFACYTVVEAENDEEAWERLYLSLQDSERQIDILDGSDWWMEDDDYTEDNL